NADTGGLAWDMDRIEVVDLLGVAEGRLIFTTPERIRAVAAGSGKEVKGWSQPDDGGKLPSYGRGFLAGKTVYWPTASKKPSLRALDIADGQQKQGDGWYDPSQFSWMQPGNMTCNNACLAVAGSEYHSVPQHEHR